MEVKSVSSSQPAFKGILGRNIQVYVNNTVEKEINNVVKRANSRLKYVNTDEIKQIKSLGDRVLQKFSDYVAPLSKNTVFDMDSNLQSSYIRYGFTNSVSPEMRIKVYNTYVYNKAGFHNNDIYTTAQTDINKISNSSVYDLKTLDAVADELFQIPARKIDKILYDNAQDKLKEKALNSTGFISKFLVRRWAKALDKFANELGIDSTNRVKAEEYLKKAKEEKDLAKFCEKSQKVRAKENERIAKEILNR